MIGLFDVGGTKIRVGVSDNGQDITNTQIVDTPQDYQQGITTLTDLLQTLSQNGKLDAIIGGLPGTLNHDRSQLFKAPHLLDWVDKDFKSDLSERNRCPIYLENDAALAGLGEANYGAGQGKKIVAYLTISTGIGGAKVVDGILDPTTYGFEPGHQIIDGGTRTFEDLASGTAIKQKYGVNADQLNDPQSWDEIAKWIAVGINNIILQWSPEVIVLGGSVSKSLPIEHVKAHLRKILVDYPEIPEIIPSSLSDLSALYGGLVYFKNLPEFERSE